MIHLEERQLLAQAVFALTRRGAASPNRRHPLTQTQIEPLYEGGVDLPAAGGQDLLDRPLRAEHDAVLHLDEAPPSQESAKLWGDPGVKPTVCPSVASRNLLLYQSLPNITLYRQADLRRRKDDTGLGTAARGIVE